MMDSHAESVAARIERFPGIWWYRNIHGQIPNCFRRQNEGEIKTIDTSLLKMWLYRTDDTVLTDKNNLLEAVVFLFHICHCVERQMI